MGARRLGHWQYQTNVTETKHFRWWNVFDDMCKIGRWSFRFGLSLTYIDPLLTRYAWKMIFTFYEYSQCAKNDSARLSCVQSRRYYRITVTYLLPRYYRNLSALPPISRPQLCSPGRSCPAIRSHSIRSFSSFPISRKLKARNGRTDGRGATLSRYMIGITYASQIFATYRQNLPLQRTHGTHLR